MIDLRECMTLDVMPEVFRKDLRIQAASYALRKTACMLMEKIDRTSVYAKLDLLPESIVDLLAVEFRAKYYGIAGRERLRQYRSLQILYFRTHIWKNGFDMVLVLFYSG